MKLSAVVSFGLVRSGSRWFEWLGVEWFGLVWNVLDWFGLRFFWNWLEFNICSSLERPRRFGLNYFGMLFWNAL